MESKLKEPFERLAYSRSQAGFGQATEAARHFGWNENTYRSHENGVRGFKNDAPKYARAFKVDPAWLLYGQGEMKRTADLTERERLAIERLRALDKRQREAFETMLGIGPED